MSLLTAEASPVVVDKIREHELGEARELQRAMLPEKPLRLHAVEIASEFRPVADVGGDFLDYFSLTDGTLGVYLGDVSGKGLPAALYAALAVGMFRGIHKTGSPPSQVMELLNKRLRMRKQVRRFCAAQYAVFDPVARALRYTSAGLPGPLHLSGRGCRVLREGGLPAGMFEEVCYSEERIELEPGDAVLFLTDGLTEARNPAGEEFGIERVAKVCTMLDGAPTHLILHQLFAEVDRFAAGRPQHDDMAAALLKLDGHGTLVEARCLDH